MRRFQFRLALSAQTTESIYRGNARYLLVESEQGLKLQLPTLNFRAYVTDRGINGCFRVCIDDSNRIVELSRL